MRLRRRGDAHPEEHDNHERWMVTYADMVTLLMVLFIILFSMSQVDQKKFDQLKAGLAVGFGNSPSIQTGSTSILQEPGQAVADAIAPQAVSLDTRATKPSAEKMQAEDKAAKLAAAQSEVDRLKELLARFNAALRAHHLEGDVKSSIDSRGLVVSLVSRHVVFEPNLATLSPRGQEVIDTLAPVLRDIPDPLQIDGHTNQVKVKPKFYPTDWELSAARAVTVLRHLNEIDHVPASRMTASAFGHEKPLVDPSKPGSQRINKRVDIVILSTLPSETRDLITQVMQDHGLGGTP
jgi:chemotaxis protein MotB